ncbi:MAG: DUF928 domain-containing protein [Cyanobacteria bacterium J06621_15]
MNHQKLSFWRNRRRLAILALGILFSISAAPVYGKYRPKRRRAASGYSRGAGSRGCSSSNIPLTLIAPQTFVGKTASKRPMLAWYTPNAQNVRFRLFELESANKAKQVGTFKEIQTKAGVNKFKLPQEYPELTLGKKYLWQIASDCFNKTVIKRAEFIVVNPPLLQKKFNTISEKVDYYSRNELWYEALEESLTVAGDGKLGRIGAKLVQDLVESETPVGAQGNVEMNKKRIEHLQKLSSIPQIQPASERYDIR